MESRALEPAVLSFLLTLFAQLAPAAVPACVPQTLLALLQPPVGGEGPSVAVLAGALQCGTALAAAGAHPGFHVHVAPVFLRALTASPLCVPCFQGRALRRWP